ncbi:MAG: magnesium transporter [Planctomycetes bacterium]|nr:magnesium transporter [Planctomycetota bacterium]
MPIKQILEDALKGDVECKKLEEFHHADVALHIHDIPESDAARVLEILDPDFAARILVECHESVSENILELVDDNQVLAWADTLPSDESAYLVSRLQEERKNKIIPKFSPEDIEEVQEILQYTEDQIGSHMQIELISIHEHETVKSCIKHIRSEVQGEDIEQYYKAYVVDDHGVLKGEIPLLGLLLGRPSDVLTNIMQPVDYCVKPTDVAEEVANQGLQHDEHSIPVVDDEYKIIGRVTLDDLGEVLVQEYEEDIGKMAGTGEEHVVEDFYVAIRERLPWLMLGLLGGIVLAFLLGAFEGKLKEYPEFVFFVPLIMSMAGNVGIQSSSIVVRGLSTGEIGITDWFPRLIRELKISFINGFACSLGLVTFAYFLVDNQLFGYIVSVCLFSVMIIAAVIGVLVPIFLKAINIEPAYSTGPFITVGNDVLGIAIYMGLGHWCLEKFS